MNHTTKLAGLFIAVGISFSSCNEIEDFPIDYGYDYYPLEIGHYVTYDVDSIVFNDFTGQIDTFKYQKKHVIDSSFTDFGMLSYKLVRYQRPDSTQAWSLSDVWHITRKKRSLEVAEENQRFIKLLFPPDDEQTWNGNQYIDSVSTSPSNWWFWKPSEWEYATMEYDVPGSVNGLQFDSTLTVLQQQDSTLIQNVYSIEKYAKHVGLIYKKFWWLEKDGDISRPWSNPESGVILTMTIAGYGRE